MKISIKEIFYTLQGEGVHWGMPSVFVRLGQCNLRCTFCDTDFLNGLEDLDTREVARIVKDMAGKCRSIIFTGGEPLMQQAALVEVMEELGQEWRFHVETNGTLHMTPFFDDLIHWVCVSPKVKPEAIQIQRADEVKVVMTSQYRNWLKEYHKLFLNLERPAHRFYISPEARHQNPYNKKEEQEDGKYPYNTNFEEVIQFCKENPEWRLNLQTHKITHIR